jgi:hypothetical protein
MIVMKLGSVQTGRDNLEDLGIDGKMIIEWIIRKEGRRVWAVCIWLRIGISDGSL